MKRCSRRLLLVVAASALFVCDAVAQEPCKLTASARQPSPACVTAARYCSATAAKCGSPASKLATTGALQALVGGHQLRLERLGPEQDRYGRLVAFAFVGDAAQSVQQTLLEQGQARVSARIGDKACADALLRAEQAARAAKRGLWADPKFRPFVG